MSQIYHQCVKESFIVYYHDLTRKVHKDLKLQQNIKNLFHVTAKFITALSVPFLPKFILFPILKFMSDVSFYNLKKRYKNKNGTQRYNFFVDRLSEKNISNNYKITEKKIANSAKKIDRSLRKIVAFNSSQLNSHLTEEEKYLQMLVRQQ